MAGRPILEFVCAAPGFHIRNRGSAVGSMVCCALSLIEDRFEIRCNGEPFAATRPAGGTPPDRRRLQGLRRLLPEWVKSPMREASNERHRQRLLDGLLQIDPAPSVVFELYKYGSGLGLELASRRGVPLVLYYDAPEVEQYRDIEGRRPPAAGRTLARERDSVRSAAAVIVYSKPVRQYLETEYGCDPARIHVFQTLDHSRMTMSDPPVTRDPPIIGYVGSFMNWHNLCGLIDAFDKVRDGGAVARLLLVGSGMSRDEVEKRVRRSPHRTDIELTGFLDGAELAERKARIDIAVLPGTMWYNLPTKIFEYGAGTRPTVAPDSPTVRSLFEDGHDLLLFNERDPKSLVRAIESLVREPKLRQRLGAALGEKIRAVHTRDAMAAFYAELLGGVADGRCKRSARL